PAGRAHDEEPQHRSAAGPGDHVVHEDEDEHAAQRPGDGIDEEQQRVGPVALDLPTQPVPDPEGEPPSAHQNLRLSRPSRLARYSIFRSDQRATSMNTTARPTRAPSSARTGRSAG